MNQKRRNLVFLMTALLFAAQFVGNYGDNQLMAIPARIYAAFNLTDMQFSSCLENLRDGGASWAAVYGVAQSRTRLKRLSSSSSNKVIVLGCGVCPGGWGWISAP